MSTSAKDVLYTAATGLLTDIAGNALANVLSGTVTEIDGADPRLLNAVYDSDTQITVTLTELANNGTINKANDGGFTVTQTGGGPTYTVTGIADDAGANDRVVLTVANMAVSGDNGVTVTYIEGTGGNGTVADPAPASNLLADDGTGVDVAIWDAAAPTIISITTQDNDNDGDVDRAVIVFDAPVDDSTLVEAGFTIGGVAATGTAAGAADDNTITITLTDGRMR